MSTTAAEADELDVRIEFGDLPTQTMPPSWAAGILRKFYARDTSKFGKYLQEYITVDLRSGGKDEAP